MGIYEEFQEGFAFRNEAVSVKLTVVLCLQFEVWSLSARELISEAHTII